MNQLDAISYQVSVLYCSCEGGNVTKTECSPGTYNSNSNSDSVSACLACDPGYYSSAGAASCTVCPAGFACPTALLGETSHVNLRWGFFVLNFLNKFVY